jgi:hypothetical protein
MQLDYLKTSKEVATMLKCTQRNISKLVKAEKLKPIKVLENGTFLFNTADVVFYINQQSQKK